MKTLKTILIAVLFVTVNFSINAETLKGMNKNKKTETVKENKVTELFTVIEEELSLENWMIQLKSWNSTEFNEEIEEDETIELENWMLDFHQKEIEDTETDQELNVEDWMLKF